MKTDSRSALVELTHGRALSVDLDHAGVDLIQLRSATGEVELAIEVGPDGPKLRVRAVDIELTAERKLAMRCAELDVQVSGQATVAAEGELQMAGLDVRVLAERGEIQLRANDDVDVRGERIRLNCDDPPMPISWEEYEQRTRAALNGGSTTGDG